MKRIGLFCDGTWNDAADPNPTNVYLLYHSAAGRDGDIEQRSHYFEGVGTNGQRLTGGAWGRGLDDIVLLVYRWLCENYDIGDDIYLFGFSRGAYTARSVVGLLRTCGVLARDHIGRADEAMRLYRRRNTRGGADSDSAKAFRAQYAVCSVDCDRLSLRRADMAPDDPRMLRIRYLGLWDTVGALGVPERIPLSSVINLRHRFHDEGLSSFVEYARHAMAIDETRNAFRPTPWTQASIDEVNNIHREIRVEQDWFPGDHGSVGGGGPIKDLSSAALLWVQEGATRAGMVFDDHSGHLAEARQLSKPVDGELSNSRSSNWMMNLRGQGARTHGVPLRASECSAGTLQRMRENNDYVRGTGQRVAWRRTTLDRIVRALDL